MCRGGDWWGLMGDRLCGGSLASRKALIELNDLRSLLVFPFFRTRSQKVETKNWPSEKLHKITGLI